MKIAIVNAWAISKKAIGGTERFVMDLAESFAKDKNQVDVYMFSGKNHKENNVNYISIDMFNSKEEADEYVIQKELGTFNNIESYKKLAKILESKIDMKDYDFIQLNSLLFLKSWENKKRIFTIHTNPFEYELAWGKDSYSKMLELMNKYKNDDNTIFVAPSKYYANEYKILTDCEVKYIPHAIEIKRLITSNSKDYICKKYNLERNKIKIVVPSRLEPKQKQPQLLLESCKTLTLEDKKKIEIIYTGLDKQYEKFIDELYNKAKEYNLNIKIARFDNIAEAYKIADIVALPSKSESFGYSALESLSLGIYTILNNIPTFNEIAIDNDYNYIFKDDKELCNALKNVIKNKKYLVRKKPSIEWKNKYSMNTFKENYLKLIK